MQRLTVALLVLLLACPMLCLAGIGFKFETAFTPPNLGGDVVMTAFTGASGDLGFQAAVASNQRIVVYNYKTNAVIRSVDYTAQRLLGLVFTDVTHDRTPDLVYAYATGGRTPQYLVIGINGATGKTDTLRFTSYVGRTLSATGGVIGAFDLNQDGFKELFVSADTGSSRDLTEVTFGQTRLYYSFPDSLLWKQLTPRIQSVSFLPWGLTHPALWLTIQAGYNFPPAHIGPDTSTAELYLMPDGSYSDLQRDLTSPCNQLRIVDWSYRVHLKTFRTTGQYGPGTEMFSITDRAYSCGLNPDTLFSHTMDLAMVFKPSVVEPVWSVELFADYDDFITDPEMMHFFFAFQPSQSALTMFNISDGTFRSQLTEIPSGHHWWDYPTSDPSPRLVVTNGAEVALYRLVATNDQPDDGVNDELPATFRLGRTYANPHQFGLTIPISIPRSGRVTVEILDRRGKRVKLLADQPMTQGKQELLWNAAGVGSGLYEIHATQGNKTDSTQVLLWH